MSDSEKELKKKIKKEFNASDLFHRFKDEEQALSDEEKRLWKLKTEVFSDRVKTAIELIFETYSLMGSRMVVESTMNEVLRRDIVRAMENEVKETLTYMYKALEQDAKRCKDAQVISNAIEHLMTAIRQVLKYIPDYTRMLGSSRSIKEILDDVRKRFGSTADFIETAVLHDLGSMQKPVYKLRKSTTEELKKVAA